MVRPSAFAVLRLMTNSNLADCLIGSLPGFGCFPKRRGQTGQLPVLSCHWSPASVARSWARLVTIRSIVAAMSRTGKRYPESPIIPTTYPNRNPAHSAQSLYIPLNLSGGCRTMRPLFVWHEYMQCDAWLPPMVTTILAAKSVVIM